MSNRQLQKASGMDSDNKAMYTGLQSQQDVKQLSNLLCGNCLALTEEYLMGVQHTKDIFETTIDWQTPTHKLLALVMAYNADRKGVIRLTQGEVAEEVGVSRQRVSTLLDDLCDLEVLKRLGHGRYGIRWGLPKDEDEREPLPSPKGAQTELKRLQAIRTPSQAIVWRKDGWPVLEEKAEVLARFKEERRIPRMMAL